MLTVDTVKAEVARAALGAGAAAINDVSALRLDPAIGGVVAAAQGGLVLMHSRGPILEIASYAHATYGGRGRRGDGRAARRPRPPPRPAGVAPGATRARPRPRLLEDGGAKYLAVRPARRRSQALGRPVLVGPSRKRFLGAVTGLPLEARDRATATACALAWERGARLFRVHDVAAAREALALAQAVGGP